MVEILPKKNGTSLLERFDFNGDIEVSVFYHEFKQLRNGVNMLTSNQHAEEEDVGALFTVDIDVPKLP